MHADCHDCYNAKTSDEELMSHRNLHFQIFLNIELLLVTGDLTAAERFTCSKICLKTMQRVSQVARKVPHLLLNRSTSGAHQMF
jgi:hypothetical protein